MPRRPTNDTARKLNKRLSPLVALALLCCGQSQEVVDTVSAVDLARVPSDVGQLPPMPPLPASARGRLVAVSAGDYEIAGTWEAHAGICQEIGVLEIYAGPRGLGTGLLARLAEGDPVGTYPIAVPAYVLPDPPASLIAVQAFDDPEAFGFQAYDGVVELTQLEASVSGHFETTLREISTDMLVHYVGVFEDLPVEQHSHEYCQNVKHSVIPPDPVSATDSTAQES